MGRSSRRVVQQTGKSARTRAALWGGGGGRGGGRGGVGVGGAWGRQAALGVRGEGWGGWVEKKYRAHKKHWRPSLNTA